MIKKIWLPIVFMVIIILIFIYFLMKPFSFSKVNESVIINLDKNEFSSGEIINFNIKTYVRKGKYTECHNNINRYSYSIYDQNENRINRTYECIGFIGQVVNFYCKNGVVEGIFANLL